MTNEEAKQVFLNRGYVNGLFDGDKWRQSIVVISEWLKQEPILDKIRAEIEQEYLAEGHLSDYWDAIDKCLQIVDKYKAESEG